MLPHLCPNCGRCGAVVLDVARND
uniref:Uncharacterized protein n=1 Tax=Arundo donax TaxID=35708 RepID=A0A0A9CG23_ARUDO